jgi:hypothetical protein
MSNVKRLFEPNPETIKARERIREYLRALPDTHLLVEFMRVEEATGVRMRANDRGRALLHEEIVRMNRPYTSKHNVGYELSSASTSGDIMADKNKVMLNAARRTIETKTRLEELHGQQMTATDRARFDAEATRTATLLAFASTRPPKSLK